MRSAPSADHFERHRLQYLAVMRLAEKRDLSKMKCLHFAPETCMRRRFAKLFATYETADLLRKDVDHEADLLSLQFDDASFDLVYASHVLEHIRDDSKAVAEIRRVLRPNGVAIIPVPIVGLAPSSIPKRTLTNSGTSGRQVRTTMIGTASSLKQLSGIAHRISDPKFQTYIYETARDGRQRPYRFASPLRVQARGHRADLPPLRRILTLAKSP